MRAHHLRALLASLWLLVPAVALAGGYDTPMLYSARHIGMGGTAVSYVLDPSAMFHNPAGLANIKRGSVLADFSLVVGQLQATPVAKPIDAETTLAPFFLVGGGYRVHERIVIGLGVYPVASAGAEYRYPVGTTTAKNDTKLVFIEASPGVAFNLPYNLSLGLGYRITYANLERLQGTAMAKTLDFELSGLNFLGFRGGLQWSHAFEGQGQPRLRVGGQYRHKTVTELTADKGIAVQPYTDISMKLTLPSRASLGARFDLYDAGVALDAEYALNSQNRGYPLKGKNQVTGSRDEVPNYFRWTDAWTLRSGLEYRLLTGKLPLRVGYIWDQKTANPRFPSAFGTPPGPSHIETVGCGWNAGSWEVSVAYAHRRAVGRVKTADIAAGQAQVDPDCAFCNGPGKYDLTMHGMYVDGSVTF